jgi:hypothetical protein
MRCALIALLAVSALAVFPAKSEETEAASSLALLQERHITTGLSRGAISDSERNTAKIKEDEFETPEAIAVIERNREDRERAVVIDR